MKEKQILLVLMIQSMICIKYIDIHYFMKTETYLYKSNIIEESIFFIKKLYYLYEPTKIMISFDLDLDLDIEKKDNLKKLIKIFLHYYFYQNLNL